MAKNITLVSPDGEHKLELPETDRVEITNKRAAGWLTAKERTDVAKAEKQADSERTAAEKADAAEKTEAAQ